MIKEKIKKFLERIAAENIALFGQGQINCAKLGEINKRNFERQIGILYKCEKTE